MVGIIKEKQVSEVPKKWKTGVWNVDFSFKIENIFLMCARAIGDIFSVFYQKIRKRGFFKLVRVRFENKILHYEKS